MIASADDQVSLIQSGQAIGATRLNEPGTEPAQNALCEKNVSQALLFPVWMKGALRLTPDVRAWAPVGERVLDPQAEHAATTSLPAKAHPLG